jgi:2-(1,2-epoxy-1,2-dihydrophenyl)acetyl-CoA isomerase
MAFETLLFEKRDQVAHVTLNRPAKLNALSLTLIEELRAAAAAVEADPSIRAVLLTGAGRAFCSGADLTRQDFFEQPGQTIGQSIGRSLTEHFNPMVSAWHAVRVPVVVAVNGVAAGAGMSLALLGDIVIAAHSATFLQLFAPKLGLLPDLGSTFQLPRLVGTARAKGMTLLGEPLSAADAVSWGLIWSSVADDSLMQEANALASRLAEGPTQAFARIKSVFNVPPAHVLEVQLELEAEAQTQLGDSRDFAEGLVAFRDKRAPRFSGL